MKKNNYRKKIFTRIIAAAVFFLSTNFLFALPGIKPYIPDSSGEYVYYRDYTFSRESYIGFLYYDDTTYAVRYYAPADMENNLPEKTVSSVFTIDAELDYVKFTGEKFLSITTDDTEIVNYLHDIIFEFDKQRKSAGTVSPSEITVPEKTTLFTDYGDTETGNISQFGGMVTVIYDYLVPLFNIKKIISSDNQTLFIAVTGGSLTSSKDNSFNKFKGFFDSDKEEQHPLLLDSEKEKTPYTCLMEDSGKKLLQSVVLDKNWNQSMENLWFLGNSSLLSINFINQDKNKSCYFKDKLIRKALLGTENSYSDWEKLSVSSTGNRITINSLYYQYISNNITNDTKIISCIDENYLGYFVMTTFNSVFLQNKEYFDKIIKNYTITVSPASKKE